MKKKIIYTISIIIILNIFSPLVAQAGIMDDFMAKRASIRYQGEILEYKVRNFDKEAQIASYPDIVNAEIPDDFQIEPFTFDNHNVGHIPQFGEFKGLSEAGFSNSKQQIERKFNNKKDNILGKYNNDKKDNNKKKQSASRAHSSSKDELKDDYQQSVQELSRLFNNKAKGLNKNLNTAKTNAEKELKENFKSKKDDLKQILKKDTTDYWGKESDNRASETKAKFNRMSQSVKTDIDRMNRLANDFDNVLAQQREKMNQHRVKYENFDVGAENKEFLDQFKVDRPEGLLEEINNIKDNVNSSRESFSGYGRLF